MSFVSTELLLHFTSQYKFITQCFPFCILDHFKKHLYDGELRIEAIYLKSLAMPGYVENTEVLKYLLVGVLLLLSVITSVLFTDEVLLYFALALRLPFFSQLFSSDQSFTL